MSEQGRTILVRMIELIDEYRARRANLRRLTDELAQMYEALPAGEQPPEREWRDALVPLDKLNSDRSGQDAGELAARIEASLNRLDGLIRARF